MKVRSYCRECLKGLGRQAVALSGGGDALLSSALALVDTLFDPRVSPTYVSNRLLRYIRQESGVEDPYADRKAAELRAALDAAERLCGFFPDTLEGALRASAFGNGGDFFAEHCYDTDGLVFRANVAKIEDAVYTSGKVLILGDNPGDFVFDLPLMKLLKEMGKRTYYAVKERPVQNDMSMADVTRLGPDAGHEDIVSTGTGEVGIREEEMSGIVRECWEDGSLVIAKGMGNYETMSEFDRDRPVVYVMRVKCQSVAEALGRNVGEYIAAIAGEENG
jgi:uncharacterized protein with ATP-grasp and redox domains